MAQIAADALEVPIERVKVYHGSTTYLTEGYGSYGSRATVMGGNAIVQTANALRREDPRGGGRAARRRGGHDHDARGDRRPRRTAAA